MLRPGNDILRAHGGLHGFMHWKKPILTDSGGFQVMSLAALRKISEEGVAFRSHLDGSRYLLTPERSVEIQRLLGADITMSFDECTSWPVSPEEAAQSMRLSMKWAERGKRVFVERAGHFCMRRGQLQTFVELHHNVATQQVLDFDRALGRERDHRAVDMRAERDAALIELA